MLACQLVFINNFTFSPNPLFYLSLVYFFFVLSPSRHGDKRKKKVGKVSGSFFSSVAE